MKEALHHRSLLTFDSGIGGLSIFQHIVRLLPRHNHLYVADDLGFPYGDWNDSELSDHLFATLSWLISEHRPRLLTIACNTASTLMLPRLRASFDIPFVGTVPAIKPAAKLSKTGMISVLATPGTVRRDYTRDLIETFAPGLEVTLVGSANLASLAEAYGTTGQVDEAAVAHEIAPCFQKRADGRRTDIIVLACTHYPFLLPVLKVLMPWPVTFLDPGHAVARRVTDLSDWEPSGSDTRQYILTSGHPFPEFAKTRPVC